MMISLDDVGGLMPQGVWVALYRGEPGVLWAHESMASSNLCSRIESTLSNGVRLILRGSGEPTLKQRLTGGAHMPASLQGWLACPTLSGLRLGHGDLPSIVFWSLPKSVSSRINMI